MCLVTRSNVRVCVWYLTITNACMFDPKRFPNANVCGMCAERVFFGVSYVDKNRAYAYVYGSLWQTRCVCMQIYILKKMANAHVLCALSRYHNKRACAWLENRKRHHFSSIAAHFLVFRAVLPSLPLVAGAMNVEQGTVATLRDAEMNEQVAATEAAPGSEIQYASPTGEIKSVRPTCSNEHLRTQTQKGRNKQAYTIHKLLPENKRNNDLKIILYK